MAGQTVELSKAIQLFGELSLLLSTNQSIEFEGAICALHNAKEYYEHDETQKFIDESFEEIVKILLAQHPSKIGHPEKIIVENCLIYCSIILLKLLKDGKHHYLKVLGQILNKKENLYKSINGWYNNMPGAPEIRTRCLEIILDENGFEIIYDVIQADESKERINTDLCRTLLFAVGENILRPRMPQDLPYQFCKSIMTSLSKLTEEDLKKEPTDSMGQIIGMIRKILSDRNEIDFFFQFWLSITLIYIRSKAIPLRLFAWEQVAELVDMAREARPPARRYEIYNAGENKCNGIYEIDPNFNITVSVIPKYMKECDNGTILTLFQCPMRSRAKWWFISEADKDKPGTDSDIDYYQHRSTIHEEREPQPSGWYTCSQQTARGKDPPPKVRRLEPFCEEGKENCSLEHQLVDWVIDNQIMEDVFGDSVHREIVARSHSVLKFLSSMERLNKECLEMIWKACIGKNEMELVDEIHALLAGLAPQLSTTLLVHLVNTIKIALGDAYSEAVAFIEKLAANGNIQDFATMENDVLDSILQLLWSILQDANIKQHKAYDIVNEFFAQMLKMSNCEQHKKFLEECLLKIKFSMENTDSDFDETPINRILFLVLFLFDNFPDPAVIVEELQEKRFPELLFQELYAWRTRSLKRMNTDNVVFQADMKARLTLIRHVHGYSQHVNISKEELSNLWNIFSSPPEREECMAFLFLSGFSKAIKHSNIHLHPTFTPPICVYAFQDLMCQNFDWTTAGERAYQCFTAYFEAIRNPVIQKNLDQDLKTLIHLGSDALWNVTLSAQNKTVASNATTDLLLFYSDDNEMLNFYNEANVSLDAEGQFLKRCFQYLAECRNQLKLGDNNLASLKAERCLGLLLGAVSGANEVNISCAHGLRGKGGRRKIKIIPKKVGGASNQLYNNRQSPPLEVLNPIDICVHPMETIKHLKWKISEKTNHSSSEISLISPTAGSKNLLDDKETIGSSDIMDDTEIVALLKSQQNIYGNNKDNDENLNTVEGSSRIGEVMAQEQEYFEILFDLFECSGLQHNHTAIKSIWELCSSIPTQENALQSVINGTEWDKLIPVDCWNKAVYYMQIVDSILQPSDEFGSDITITHGIFVNGFMENKGFDRVLNVFMGTVLIKESNSIGIGVALRILKYCLFESGSSKSFIDVLSSSSIKAVNLLNRLIQVAITAHQSNFDNSSDIIITAMEIILKIIESPDMFNSFLSNNGTKKFVLSMLLDNQNRRVRDQASTLINSIVSSGVPVMFNWLSEALINLPLTCCTCTELFNVVKKMVKSEKIPTSSLKNFVQELCRKLLGFPRNLEDSVNRQMVLDGILKLFFVLVTSDYTILDGTELGEDIVNRLFEDLLFALPSLDVKENRPICSEDASINIVYMIFKFILENNKTILINFLNKLEDFTRNAVDQLRTVYNFEINYDAKQSPNQYVGLRNQGCTCYMNALLQNLFMIPTFRDAILSAKIQRRKFEDGRNFSDEEVVGKKIQVHFDAGQIYEAEVLSFDDETGYHKVKYDVENQEEIDYNLRAGRPGFETGEFSVIISPTFRQIGDKSQEHMETTQRVLEEVQRTFCHLKYSEKRYYDPRPLVEACKCLQLNYSVYQQNDASEFCDQLLDRLEASLKLSQDGINYFQQCFGGSILYQKIPQGCSHIGNVEEPFIKIECPIKGKENIHESLETFIEGELMDGDNKVQCEGCNGELKATIRRTCVGKLPNVLVLHLKRFDFDFNTLETLKLNGRCAFPNRLNIGAYTKEGLEEKERDEKGKTEEDTCEKSMMLDDDEYEYEVKGVLIHAGIAQGGHYYSFIKDRNTENEWYRFDDEDVSPFDPKNIESSCFGGTTTKTTTWQGITNTVEQERLANALLLFYEKVKPRIIEVKDEESEGTKDMDQSSDNDVNNNFNNSSSNNEGIMDVFTDGYEAFETDVRNSNIKFLYYKYLFNEKLHKFLRDILAMGITPQTGEKTGIVNNNKISWKNEDGAEEIRMKIIKANVAYFLDIVLHARERIHMKKWIDYFKECFSTNINACLWFIETLCSDSCPWLKQYFLDCGDINARRHVYELVSNVIGYYASLSNESSLLLSVSAKAGIPSNIVEKSVLAKFLNCILELLYETPRFQRNSDELFMLIHCAAKKSDAIRHYLVECDLVALLFYFVLGEKAPQSLRDAYPKVPILDAMQHAQGFEFMNMVEVITVLVGVPQVQKVTLIEEAPTTVDFQSDYQLSSPAREALTWIFQQSMGRNEGMNLHDVTKYLERCGTPNAQLSAFQIKSILQKYDQKDGRMTLLGFLSYYKDLSIFTPKVVWQHLHIFGFKNDLQRAQNNEGFSDSLKNLKDSPKLALPSLSSIAVLEVGFYEQLIDCFDTDVPAILTRVCHENMGTSVLLLNQILGEFKIHTMNPSSYSLMNTESQGIYFRLLGTLATIPDDLKDRRLEHIFYSTEYGVFEQIQSIRRVIDEKIQNNEQSNVQPNLQHQIFILHNHVDLLFNIVRFFHAQVYMMQDWLEERKDAWDWALRISTELRNRSYNGYPSNRRNVESDDDSDFERKIISVTNCGNEEVNGEYEMDGNKVDHVPKYVKSGIVNNEKCNFTIFRCNLSSGEKRWYISIIPDGLQPGLNTDIDYYHAVCSAENSDDPPTHGWVLDSKGTEPPPIIQVIPDNVGESDEAGLSPVTNEMDSSHGSDIATSNGSPQQGLYDDNDDDAAAAAGGD